MTRVGEALRKLVIERAGNCYEYCLLSQEDSYLPFEIDHIISEKHQGETIELNLCLSCPDCNGYKGSNIGSIDLETQLLTPLFNPRQQRWSEHFRLKGAIIEPLTAEGRVTVLVLRLNKPEIVEEREGLLSLERYPCQIL